MGLGAEEEEARAGPGGLAAVPEDRGACEEEEPILTDEGPSRLDLLV